jgi:hypothetical protein
MWELFMTLGGVGVVGLTAVYSTVIDQSKTAAQRSILVTIAVIGLGLGIAGAVIQEKESEKSGKALTDLQNSVGKLDAIDRDIKTRSEDLTKLDLLGGAKYYVVLGTYPDNMAGNNEFERVLGDVKTFFPDADGNGMIWKHPKPNGQYEMGFGRNLSPAAAEVYLRLAEYLAKDQHPMMRLER